VEQPRVEQPQVRQSLLNQLVPQAGNVKNGNRQLIAFVLAKLSLKIAANGLI